MDTNFGSRDNFAYDISDIPLTKGEVKDIDAINLSILNILTTNFGERIHLPNFGSILPAILFENLYNSSEAEKILDSILDSIEKWENRITVDREHAQMNIIRDDNAMELLIPWTLNQIGLTSEFQKRIIF